MGTPFKLKSGNASEFKNLGSSPAKQGGNNLKRIMAENKATAKAAGTFYPPPADFNTKGGPTKTPGHGTTKLAKIKEANKVHHKVTKGLEAMRPPKKAIVKPTLPKNFNKTGSGNTGKTIISKKDVARNTKQALKNVNTVSSKTNKGSKVVELLKKGKKTVKKVLKHPTTKKVLKVLKAASKINPALGIMPAPFINPTGQSYNKNQEG